MLRPTVSRPVCLGIKHPFRAYDQILITVRPLRVCWSGVISDERTGLSFTIAADPRQRSHSRVHVLWDSRAYFTVTDSRLPFRHLLRLAGLRWRYSTPPPDGIFNGASRLTSSLYNLGTDSIENSASNNLGYYVRIRCNGNVFIEYLTRNCWLHQLSCHSILYTN
jgi:hypothetical protein